MKRSARLALTAAAAANLGVTFLVQAYALHVIGLGESTDAFFAAQAIPVVVTAILASAVNNAVLPVLSGTSAEEAAALTWRLLGIALLGTIAVYLAYLPVRHALTALLFSGLGAEARRLVATLSLLSLAAAAFQIATSLVAAWAASQEQYVRVELVQAVTGLVAAVAIVPAAHRWSVAGVAGIFAVRAFFGFCILLLSMPRVGRNPTPGALRAIGRRIWPLVSAGAIYKTGPLINRSLASQTMPGDLTIVGYAEQLCSAILGIAERVATRPLLAAVSRLRNGSRDVSPYGAYEAHTRQLRRPAIAWVAASSAGGLLLFGATDIAGWLTVDQRRIGLLFLFMMQAVPAGLAGQFAAAYLYGLGRTIDVSRWATLSFAISCIARLGGLVFFGVWGLVAGIVLYQALNWLFLANKARSTR